MDRTEVTVEALAAEAGSWFERARRDDGSDYVRTRDDRPEWLTELVYSAHGDFLPDDFRYAVIWSALQAIEEGQDDAHEFADGEVDVYTSALIDWLGSNGRRTGYVDEASELFGEAEDIVSRSLARGQFVEIVEIFELVRSSLEDRADEVSA